MERTSRFRLVVSVAVLCCCQCSAQQITVADGSLSRPPTLQVDGEGRAFVGAGRQLLRLNSELVPEQNITLPADAVDISLSSGGERLVVCLEDSSCAVYNASDLSAEPSLVQASALTDVVNGVALFTAGDSYYTGSHELMDGTAVPSGIIRLTQVGGLEGANFVRDMDYDTFPGTFQRDFFAGFMSGTNAYFIASDTNPDGARGIKVMRVCHVTGCPGGSATCGISALYEEQLVCGDRTFSDVEDGVCGVSVIEDFAGTTGTGIVISRCRRGFQDSNVVCYVPVAEVDRIMDTRYDSCSLGNGFVNLEWTEFNGACRQLDFREVCEFTGEVGDIREPFRPPEVITVGADVGASVAVQLEGFSLVVVAYTLPNDGGNSVAIFEVTSNQVPTNPNDDQTLGLTDAFGVKQAPSVVRTLQWHTGLDYVLAATDTEVLRIPVEECSSSLDCSSCVTNGNPLCGWCVVEDKCSRQSQCQNGNSTDSIRWRSSSSANLSTQCINNTVTPNQFLLDDQQVLSVSVSGPGLPAVLVGESYSCHFEDSLGRFNITVPSMEVTPGAQYTCNITNIVQQFDGVQAVMHFSFVSSLVGIPFDTADIALTIFSCAAASRCTDCLGTGSACGWCVVNKLCRGIPQDCRDPGNFLLLGASDTFEDVCPLLDLNEGSTNYTQHVRVANSLQLTTRNLPDIVANFSYMCRIRDTMFPAVRDSESSLTCQIELGQIGVGSLNMMSPTEIADISIIWMGPSVAMHTIDTINNTKVIVYDCNLIAGDCSSCVGSRATPGILCGWCDSSSQPTCSIDDDTECMGSPPFYTTGPQCPQHRISSFLPSSGPPSGGTIITIRGRDLGVTFDDFSAPNSTTVGGVSCTPLSMGYESGTTVLCETGADLPLDAQDLVVTLLRDGAPVAVTAQGFMVIRPTLISVEPVFGPIAGGSELRVSGTGLDIGNTARVTLNETAGPECSISGNRTATEITCTTPNVTSVGSEPIVIQIDNEVIQNGAVTFEYRSNPTFTSVMPQMTIPEGGITLTFTGENLDVAQNPQLVFSNGARSPCAVESSTTLTCITPPLDAAVDMSTYVLVLDNAPFPEVLPEELQVSVSPTPTGFTLTTDSVQIGAESRFIQIEVMNLESVEETEIIVFVGGELCGELSKNADNILCQAPDGTTLNLDSNSRASVNVSIGTNFSLILNETLLYEEDTGSSVPLTIIIPAIAAPAVIIFLCCVMWILVIVCYSRRAGKRKEQQYSNLIAKMELLEYEMADECKRAFTELQTDLADLVQISSDKNLPYRDFRTFAMRFLFPKADDDHPVLLPLQLTGVKIEEEAAMKHLDSFRELIMDKKFLLVFVHTLENQRQFSLQDKCDVASLLMVAFQNDLDYATEVLQTLLAELMRKTIAKSHPKLLLRRTDSVAEKMLANWQAFLLFPYLLEHVGEPLFILYRAIKSQLEKGPVDVISGEAKNSLSEEKLLRQHMEVKPVEGVIQHEEEELPIRMWDCDSISQAKEKVLDVLYRNTPVSKRPQITGVDLELIGKGANGVTLRDQDATNSKDGEWVKVNTLGHYKLDEMSKSHSDNPKLPIPRFKITDRPERPLSGVSNFDTLGTIISNISAANRSSMVMSNSELSHTYHLVKPEPENGDGTGQKIMSEVFLTRLLSTKRILQPYVDKLFEAVFEVPHGKALPKAIKCLFDFLDLQAAELGITDSDVLHSWKTNSVPLRFWVNVIKNPDFVFDINKSATVDSCLTVIAQAYIDATSTADIKYTKDTPSARLLYVNEVKKYRAGVESYYSVIQSLPKLSNTDMAEYLRETAQVCANSVKQYDPTVVNDPALMTRKLYFVTESALYELFKYANEYSEDIIDALNEEGLTIPAAQFDQVRKAMS